MASKNKDDLYLLLCMAEDMAVRLDCVTGENVKEMEELSSTAWEMAQILRNNGVGEDAPAEDTSVASSANPLLKLVDEYKELIDKKEELEEATKENNKALEAKKAELAQAMIDEECPGISRNGFKYSLQEKVRYNKRSEEDLSQLEVPFFDFLREEGLGDIIKETVNANTLSSAIKSLVDEVGELPEHYLPYIKPYETYEIMKRKETNKAGKKGD